MCDDSHVYEIEEKRVMNANAYILFYINKESPYKNDYFRLMKSLMNNVEKNEKEKEVKIKLDKNFFKGEPVVTNYGEGYVMEDNIDEFIFDENYDIYDDLRKRDCKRIEKIIKKDKEEEEQEKNKDKNGNKEENEEDKNKENKKEEGKRKKKKKLMKKKKIIGMSKKKKIKMIKKKKKKKRREERRE